MVLCNEACAAAMGLKREAGGGAAGGPKGGRGPAAQLEVQELRCVAGLGVCCNNGATAERGWDGTKKGAARSRAVLGCCMGWDEWWSRGRRSVLGLDETRPSTKQPSLPSWDGSWLGRIFLGSVSRSTKVQGQLQCKTINGQKTATIMDRRANVVRASPKYRPGVYGSMLGGRGVR